MRNNFVEIINDKFKNQTTTQMKTKFCLKDSGLIDKDSFVIGLRHVSMPNTDGSVVDIEYSGEDWFFLGSGKLFININNVENIVLKPHESYSDCGHGICIESDFYEIDQATLKRICEANTIDVKITGRNHSEVFHVNRFIIYAQQFYNAVYDSNAYQESLKMGYVGTSGDNGCIVTLLMIFSTLSTLLTCIALIMGVI
ncbi:MAG: hypothetical protein IJR84_07915 [Bacteroidaceae bacterium]|nr:hypothetical protein [Bacteroidaceae bacterium]